MIPLADERAKENSLLLAFPLISLIATVARAKYHYPIDTTLTMDVMRDWQHLTMRAQVARYPEDPGRFLNRVDPQKNRVAQLSMLGIEIDEEIAKLLAPLRQNGGALVVAIDSEDTSPDDRLLPGDIVHALNRRGTRSCPDVV